MMRCRVNGGAKCKRSCVVIRSFLDQERNDGHFTPHNNDGRSGRYFPKEMWGKRSLGVIHEAAEGGCSDPEGVRVVVKEIWIKKVRNSELF